MPRRVLLLSLAVTLLAELVTAVPTRAATDSPARAVPGPEVWQAPQAAYPENPTNPLAGRRWGVYLGPQDQVYAPYVRSRGVRQALLSTIALRPRTKWYDAWVPDRAITSTVQSYIATSQAGDPTKLVQLAVFRMQPWEHEACARRSTSGERRSYKRWIDNLAAGIGSTPTLVVMQPDGPFLWCVPDLAVKSRLLSYATETLSALPQTSVYIDAGAADWCENGRGNDPERCAQILARTGIEHARGFALDSTHYMGAADNIAHGAAIAAILQRDGYGTKHFILDTAKSGRPMAWGDVVPDRRGDLKDNARVCRSVLQARCVTLGIPPTVRVADSAWGLAPEITALARRYVDGFVWFGRPWLHNQADPFVMRRALDLAASTPWPAPVALSGP